jgi:hypothetical protein
MALDRQAVLALFARIEKIEQGQAEIRSFQNLWWAAQDWT